MGKWYGSLDNRLDENKMFCDKIEVGTGVTKYSWSDRHPYEVIAVKDQKHVTIREMDHIRAGECYSNKWELKSNPDNPAFDVVKRGKFWYSVSTCTVEEAKKILSSENNLDERLWACHNGFDLSEIVETGKDKKKFHRMNISFGVAEYYYDYSF